MDNEDLSFDSYNAMGRTATYAGVPQFVLLGIMAAGILITVVSCVIFSWYGLISLIIPVSVFAVVRIVCETDSRFINRLLAMLRRYIRNMAYGKSLLITPVNPKWQDYYGRRIAQERFISRK